MRKIAAFFLVILISLSVGLESAAQVPDREQILSDRINKLERRLSELEAKLNHQKQSTIDRTETKVVDLPLTGAFGQKQGVW